MTEGFLTIVFLLLIPISAYLSCKLGTYGILKAKLRFAEEHANHFSKYPQKENML